MLDGRGHLLALWPRVKTFQKPFIAMSFCHDDWSLFSVRLFNKILPILAVWVLGIQRIRNILGPFDPGPI